MSLSQSRYLLKLLQKFGFDGAKSVTMPLAANVSLSAHEGDILDDPTQYRKMLGTLPYLTLTRLDVAFAVNYVCQFMQTPRVPHLIVIKRIFWYLKGTLNLGTSTHKNIGYNFACIL